MKKFFIILLVSFLYGNLFATVLNSDTITKANLVAENCTIVVKSSTTITVALDYIKTSSASSSVVTYTTPTYIYVDDVDHYYKYSDCTNLSIKKVYFRVPASSLSEGKHRLSYSYQNNTSLWYNFYIVYQTKSMTCCSHAENNIYIAAKKPKRWEKSTNNGQTWTNISCTSCIYKESNPSAGIVLYRALNNDNTYSDVVTITYVDAVPSTIQALPATSTKTVDESITFTADVTDNGYKYQWKKNGSDISGATKRTYTISTIKSSHAGNYTCYVSNGCNGVTTTTAKLTVNKCAQVINFPEIPTQTYSSGLTYTLPQKTNKGLTITYQSMNTSVATISGNVLTIKAPGTAVITATQTGNTDYLEATPVSRTLTVNKRSQVITFGELPVKTYEDLPFTLPQKTNEGLTISYTSTNTTVATVSGNTVTILKPGTTDIIASQAGDATHYAAAQVSQTLTVKKAVQTITFGTLANKTYGDAPFELSKVSNKNLTITYTSSDASLASISNNVVTINKPGTVTITANQAGNAYYLAAEPVERTLTINKASQSINFPSIDSRAYDSKDFTLPSTTDKGEKITYVSSDETVATITNNTVHITGAGTTEITASQAGNDYYTAAPSVSQSFTVTKAYQTINFPTLQNAVYGQDPITLNATVNSGLEIEYESSNPSVASVNGNTLTIVSAGQCYITASVAGNKNYFTATPVERTLVVNKATPTIDFASLEGEYTYGDAPIALVASSNGGKVNFTSSNPSKLMIVGTNAMIQGAGNFTITASVAEDANHLFVSTSQNISVGKATLTATANDASRLYGESNPIFTYVYNGFVNGDTKADLSASINASTDAIITSPVGTYEIQLKASIDENYDIICKKGVLTIDKAPLTIATDGSREYGENNPIFEFSYSGFKNNENNEILSAQPQAYTTAKKSSAAGTYPIYISGATANNYDISYGESFLTVSKAPLTITALNATRKRYEENPSFELSYSGFKLEDTSADLEKLPTIICNATLDSPVGTYPIILDNDGFATNYEYILVDGVLTVEKRLHTIAANVDLTMGTISYPSQAEYLDEVTMTVIPNYGYHFVRWSDGVTSNPRNFILLQDTAFSAELTKNKYAVHVSSVNSAMGTTSGNAEALYLDNMQISATANYGYHFTQWSDGVTENPRSFVLTRDTSFIAEFAPNKYTITFKNGEQELQSTEVEYGQIPVYSGVSPVKPATTQYTYTFSGWTPEVVAVTGDATYTATFDSIINKFTITFMNGEQELQSTEVEYGQVPAYNGATPTKPADAQYTYSFIGWSPEVVAVTGDAMYQATFNATKNSYTITWQNEDGSLIDQTTVEYGVVPSHAEPTKEATAEYTYTFAGWTPEVVAVTGDATYKATFIATKNSYTITWQNEDGSLIDQTTVEYGVIPTHAEPTKEATAEYTYTFAGWAPEVIAVTGDAMYRATFNATKNSYTITWQNEDGSLIDQTTVVYGVVPTHAEPTKEATAEYTFTFAGWSPDVVAVTGDVTYIATFDSIKNSYTITWQNEDGSLIDQTIVEYGVVPSHAEPTKEATAEYTYTFAGWTPEVVAVTGDATYKATFIATKNSYTITWQNEDGSLIDQTTVEYGVIPTHAEPTKEATAEYTYTFAGWTPEVVAVTGDATYIATFNSTKNKYLIVFQDEDGTELKSEQVEYGEMPIAPAAPSKEPTSEYIYTFAGWMPEIVVVTKDATYTATYDATPVSEGIEEISSEDIAPRKVMIDGNVFILRGEKVYNAQGALVSDK